jgi:hypothetical protein
MANRMVTNVSMYVRTYTQGNSIVGVATQTLILPTIHLIVPRASRGAHLLRRKQSTRSEQSRTEQSGKGRLIPVCTPAPALMQEHFATRLPAYFVSSWSALKPPQETIILVSPVRLVTPRLATPRRKQLRNARAGLLRSALLLLLSRDCICAHVCFLVCSCVCCSFPVPALSPVGALHGTGGGRISHNPAPGQLRPALV